MQPTPLNGSELAVMRAFGRLMVVMPKMLDADLQRTQRMSLSEYQTLRHLSETPGNVMRMSELAHRCDMSFSGMTRLVSKLESLGHLSRRRCESDGRGFDVQLTEAGFERLREAWPDHLESVRRRIFDHLGRLDLGDLAAALEGMNESGGQACHSAACDK
ncbi:MarR family winged helix-turn-helix transcriptional regulator [Symbioplanes lichenis]|uniref:MarR family winged helix-turn-helix transcriptional regulator n=1 Tax=Symbioplanes lichenis TaxID=1629072 RepID=UPI002738E6CA|nr:MarR family transcriptional regulator [Actinoplanes lichenis]